MRLLRSIQWWLLVVLIGAVVLAACGDDAVKDTPTATPENSRESAPGNALSLNAGPGLDLGGEDGITAELPGCSDPDDSECPMPLVMDLDGEASNGAVRIHYPARYFDVTAGEGDPILFTITPSENNKFAETAVFEVYLAESEEAALAALEDPESAPWTAGELEGTIGVTRDETQDPPVTTTIGAFALDDGRAVVIKLTTTGKYGWDLWSQVYTAMLDTLQVTAG